MTEFLLIVVIGLVVIGPQRLPEVLRTLGKWMAQFKRATNELRSAVSEEVNRHPEVHDLREFKESVEAEVNEFRNSTETYVAQAQDQVTGGIGDGKDALRALAGDPGELADPAPEQLPAPPPAKRRRRAKAAAADGAGPGQAADMAPETGPGASTAAAKPRRRTATRKRRAAPS